MKLVAKETVILDCGLRVHMGQEFLIRFKDDTDIHLSSPSCSFNVSHEETNLYFDTLNSN